MVAFLNIASDVPPKWSPSRVMQAIKGKRRRIICCRTTGSYAGRYLWARGYFVATTGNVSDEMVARYIETQDADTEDDDFRVTE